MSIGQLVSNKFLDNPDVATGSVCNIIDSVIKLNIGTIVGCIVNAEDEVVKHEKNNLTPERTFETKIDKTIFDRVEQR